MTGIREIHPRARKAPRMSLDDDVHALAADGGLLDQLETLLAEPVSDPTTGTRARNKATSSEPWHGEASLVVMLIHAGARELEIDLRYRAKLPIRERGGTTANTKKALNAVTRLVAAVPPEVARDAERQLAGWVALARKIRDVDEVDEWVPVPRPRDAPPPECPYCATYTLRMCRRRTEVRCFNPQCHDDDGQRPVARMEYGAVSGEAALVFRDGRTVHYRGEEASA
jgi:hypothetical protein